MKGKSLKAKGRISSAELTHRNEAIALYGRDMIEAVERGEADIKAGRVTRIEDVKNIWKSIFITKL